MTSGTMIRFDELDMTEKKCKW